MNEDENGPEHEVLEDTTPENTTPDEEEEEESDPNHSTFERELTDEDVSDSDGEEHEVLPVEEEKPNEEQPPADKEPDPPQEEEEPADEVETPDSDEPEPPSWNGWSVHESGLTLFEIALEDPESDEAKLLIYGEFDEEGNQIREGVGEREYDRIYQKYLLAKQSYDGEVRANAQTWAKRGVQAIIAEANALPTLIKEVVGEEVEGLGPLEPFKARAEELLQNERLSRARKYLNMGYSEQRAVEFGDAETFSVPNAYKMAIWAAIGEKFFTNPAEALKALRAVSNAKPAAEAPQKPKESKPAAIVDEPPVVVPTGNGGKKPDNPYRGISRQDLEWARELGVDPKKFAEYKG